jgi:hypothetical protein
MKYTVASVASMLLGTLLISAAYVQTHHAEQKAAILRTHLSAMSIRELSTHFWECGPQAPGERYHRDAAFCAEVDRAIATRANELPAFQIVNASRPPMMLYLPGVRIRAVKIEPMAVPELPIDRPVPVLPIPARAG